MDTTWNSTTKSSFKLSIFYHAASQYIQTCNAYDAVTRSVINTGICYDMNDQGLRRRRGFTTGTWQ